MELDLTGKIFKGFCGKPLVLFNKNCWWKRLHRTPDVDSFCQNEKAPAFCMSLIFIFPQGKVS